MSPIASSSRNAERLALLEAGRVWVADRAQFVMRALLHRRLYALCIVASTVALVLAGMPYVARSYSVQSSLLIQDPAILPALLTRDRAVLGTTETRVENIDEIMRSDQALKAIVANAELVQSWSKTRSSFGKLKETLRAALMGPLDDKAVFDALVDMVGRRSVTQLQGRTIVTDVRWPSAQGALAIALASQRLFLDRQRQEEQAQLNLAISLLKPQLAQAKRELEKAAFDLDQVVRARAGLGTPEDVAAVARSPEEVDVSEDTYREDLVRQLDQVQTSIDRALTQHDMRLMQTQNALNAIRNRFGPSHPDTLRAEEVFAQQSVEPVQLGFLRARQEGLEGKIAYYRKRAQKRARDLEDTDQTNASTTVAVPTVRPVVRIDPLREERKATWQQRAQQLRFQEDLLTAAQSALTISQLAFSHRYVVTQPPQLPRAPDSPKTWLLVLSSILAGLFLAFFFSAWAELRDGRITAPWQVASSGIPLLGVAHRDDFFRPGRP